MTQLVLASSSKYRQRLLSQMGFANVSCMAPDIDETPACNESPETLCFRLAQSKARKVAKHCSPSTGSFVIGADQVAVIDGEDGILGKPLNYKNALNQLQRCSGKTVNFYTGLCLINTATKSEQCLVETFKVVFRDLSDKHLHNYLMREQPYDCAGSFKCEGLGITLFTAMQGEDPNALIGLPLIKLTNMLINEGVHPLDQPRPD